MFNIAKQTVIVSEGLFEEHPESYCPRVFVAENPEEDAEPVHKVYELLMDGQAIPWDCLPQKESCGFDFWTIYVDSTYYDVVMNRAPRCSSQPVSQPSSQSETASWVDGWRETDLPGFMFPADLADCITRITDAVPVHQLAHQTVPYPIPQTVPYPVHQTAPVLQPVLQPVPQAVSQAVPQADGDSGDETSATTLGAGYCTCKIHSSTHGSIDHLPEESFRLLVNRPQNTNQPRGGAA